MFLLSEMLAFLCLGFSPYFREGMCSLQFYVTCAACMHTVLYHTFTFSMPVAGWSLRYLLCRAGVFVKLSIALVFSVMCHIVRQGVFSLTRDQLGTARDQLVTGLTIN